jgi:hypothetical protein
MPSDPEADLRAFVERWRTAGPRLEELRREELRNVDVAKVIESLNGAFEATLAGPVRTTSGLVEQQAIFSGIGHARSPCAPRPEAEPRRDHAHAAAPGRRERGA